MSRYRVVIFDMEHNKQLGAIDSDDIMILDKQKKLWLSNGTSIQDFFRLCMNGDDTYLNMPKMQGDDLIIAEPEDNDDNSEEKSVLPERPSIEEKARMRRKISLIPREDR